MDRTALGEQALDVFKEVKLGDLMPLADIYNIKGLEDKEIGAGDPHPGCYRTGNGKAYPLQ